MPLHTVEREGFFASHVLHLDAASQALHRAETGENEQLDCLGTIAFSALAIEALTNDVGGLLVERWNRDLEQAPVRAKLRYLCLFLGIDLEWEKQPWQGVRDLIYLRNLIVHAKPRQFREEFEIEHDNLETYTSTPLEEFGGRLEGELNLEVARSAVAAAISLKELLLLKIPAEKQVGLDGAALIDRFDPPIALGPDGSDGGAD